METPQVKSDIVRVIQDLPNDATVGDAMERSRMKKSKPGS